MKNSMKVLWTVVIVLLMMLLVSVGVLLWRNTSRQNDYKDQVALGDKYLTEMKYENAEICFKEAIAINPKQAKPYIQLSEVYVQTQRYDDALEILDEALEKIPSSETKKVDAIRSKRSQVEAIIGEQDQSAEAPKEQEQAEEPKEIVYQVEILDYNGNSKIQYPQISPSTPEVDAWNQHFLQKAADAQNEETAAKQEGEANAFASLEPQVTYLEGNMLSVVFYYEVYRGGAHPMHNTYGETIDLTSDHMYKLEELLNTDNVTARQMVNQGFDQVIVNNPDRYTQGQTTNADENFSGFGYWRSDEGVVVASQEYTLTDYASGTDQIVLQPVQ